MHPALVTPLLGRLSNSLPVGSAWTPASLGSSLKGWWRADQGVRARTAAQFTAANSESLSRASEAAVACGDIDFYFAAWVMIDSTSATNRIWINKGPNTITTTNNYCLYKDTANKPAFRVTDATTPKTTTWGSALTTATWYFVECYHDAANDLVGVCVNRGTDVTAATAGIVPNSGDTNPLHFGAASVAGALPSDGRMGNVVFFKRLPSAAERNALYNSGNGVRYADAAAAGVSLTSLTGWWELDENSGTRADKTASALTLSDNNTVTANDGKVDYAAADGDAVWSVDDMGTDATDDTQTTWSKRPLLDIDGINSKHCLLFDGTNDCITRALDLSADGSYSIWFVFKTTDTSAVFIEHGPSVNTDDGFVVYSIAFTERAYINPVGAPGATAIGALDNGWASDGAVHCATLDVDSAGTTYIRKDGDATQSSVTNWGNGVNATLNTGDRNNGSGVAPLSGRIAERIILTAPLTGTNLVNMKAYLSARYGITFA